MKKKERGKQRAKKRANGEGNSRKRKDGRWEGRYTAGVDPETGKPIAKSVLARTQRECKEKLQKAMEELEKIDITKPVRSLTEVERLGAYLKYASDEEYQDYVRQILSEEDMDMTENTYRKVSQDELEYERREARLKYQLQYNTEISVAREQGLAQGLAKGRREGEAAGLKKGEAQKQREIAKNLKALNLTKEQIAEATGLSAAEIEKL